MRDFKRVTVLCGHYGSGKTNVAVNLAYKFRESFDNVAIADLDIVNPYFRTLDSRDEFIKRDIKLICSEFAGGNLDIPALPQEMYALTDDESLKAVIDVGGDDRGAYVLGRLAPKLKLENNYEMLMVINKFRPLTRDAKSTIEVMNEIEAACNIRFTGLVNNSNLGVETTPEMVLESENYANEVASISGVPLVMTTVKSDLFGKLTGKIENLFPLDLQRYIYSEN